MSQKFIEKITFDKDFPPFAEGQEIKFGGEKEVQELIEFYLKSKGIKNAKKNAERFKINCLLGNNGGGKSKLIEYIFRNQELLNYGNLNTYSILDDFYKLSSYNDESVNYRLFSEQNLNNFYINFYNQSLKFKKLYSEFLNLEDNFHTTLEFNLGNWKKNFKGNYFDFISNDGNYIDDNNKHSVSDEINYEDSLNFFSQLNDLINSNNFILEQIGIGKNESIQIWLYLSELFLLTVNHFDMNMSIDDDFTKHMVYGRERFKDVKGNFKEDGLLIYSKYRNYKLALTLLDNFLSINLDLCSKNKFKKEYILREEGNQKIIFKNLNNIQFNLRVLLKNLSEIENNIHKKRDYGIFHYEQKYPFRNIYGEEFICKNFIDKIQGSKYSSQSNYLLINLLFGYSDTDCYTLGYDKNSYSDKQIKENKDIIDKITWFFYDGSINYAENISNKRFKYSSNDTIKDGLEEFLSVNFLNLDIFIGSKSFNNLSAGEKTILTRFTNIYRAFNISQEKDLNSGNTAIVLVDEPDLHLHLDWQRQYIQKLIDVFSTLSEDIQIHFIIATHSPFIISDLPGESIVKLQGDGKGNTEVSYMDKSSKTFGANYIDLIQDGFFFEHKNLMGSFAETVIGGIADDERKRILEKEDIDTILKENIGDDFLKNNLVYFHKKDEKN